MKEKETPHASIIVPQHSVYFIPFLFDNAWQAPKLGKMHLYKNKISCYHKNKKVKPTSTSYASSIKEQLLSFSANTVKPLISDGGGVSSHKFHNFFVSISEYFWNHILGKILLCIIHSLKYIIEMRLFILLRKIFKNFHCEK